MSNKKKLKLENIKVKSFITSEEAGKVQGGLSAETNCIADSCINTCDAIPCTVIDPVSATCDATCPDTCGASCGGTCFTCDTCNVICLNGTGTDAMHACICPA